MPVSNFFDSKQTEHGFRCSVKVVEIGIRVRRKNGTSSIVSEENKSDGGGSQGEQKEWRQVKVVTGVDE